MGFYPGSERRGWRVHRGHRLPVELVLWIQNWNDTWYSLPSLLLSNMQTQTRDSTGGSITGALLGFGIIQESNVLCQCVSSTNHYISDSSGFAVEQLHPERKLHTLLGVQRGVRVLWRRARL